MELHSGQVGSSLQDYKETNKTQPMNSLDLPDVHVSENKRPEHLKTTEPTKHNIYFIFAIIVNKGD